MENKNMWEKHAERMRREEELQRFGERLQKFHDEHYVLFSFAAGAIAGLIVTAALGLKILLEWIGSKL